ncbi:MAG: DNA-3-methyladenine glycosylase 2 family protein [Firmicutes bacterium]|nr:DNA-3-methyladenine glycosylase 2 family protein [Bacillota bacterium]
MRHFPYGETEIKYLKQKDEKLACAIEHIGMIEREITPDPFEALISSIVSQQISKKAAQTVWNRLQGLVGPVYPQNILAADEEAIQQCGMSARKAGYIRGIAEAANSGRIDFAGLDKLSDAEIIRSLSALRGVGVWTVEMLLIFSLARPNIVSFNDLAIRRGMMNLYGLTQLSRDEFEHYRARYSPYGSVASLYLWELSAQ